MIGPFEKDWMASPASGAFIDQLKQIYAVMDRAYQQAADHYRFVCDGCRDNCCRTRFYHHTTIEYAYLMEGLKTLNSGKKNEVISRALTVLDETGRADNSGTIVRLMCPLNFDERCILYPYRPMICRLHGMPHELQKPGQNSVYGSGCETFYRRCGRQDYVKFDRTPFYRQMAMLEQEVKQTRGVAGKIRMSIAEMIADFHS